ncbi:twitch domain-containing radical SAM protein [bacterium]|nr:twitch domain-containing radical SAM protein [bacterium]
MAKWTQVTMHLHNGHTHSCHHPAPHFVSVEEVTRNPHALHNSLYKIEQRKKMLKGEKPNECGYCWKAEEDKDALSDRHYKSGESWNEGQLIKILQDPFSPTFLPTYVEVSFNNTCNFACMYCSPQISSKWMEDVKKFGSYDIGQHEVHNLDFMEEHNQIPILAKDENPYINAFWKIWPELFQTLKVFRITGGEPLLSKHTWKVLEYLSANPNPQLELGINTNLGVDDVLIDRLIVIANELISNNKIKSLDLYTSVEAFGVQAEYIRDGLDFEKFLNNLHKVSTEIKYVGYGSFKVIIMATYNLLSIPSFRQLLEWILNWRSKHSTDTWKTIWLDISHLNYPDWQTVALAGEEQIRIMEEDLTYMKANKEQLVGHHGFQDTEISKMERVLYFAKDSQNNDNSKIKKQFHNFFNMYDLRRKKDFAKTFPELKELCKDFTNA